jgi:hypothetical protein
VNALRYFPERLHAELAPEFAAELATWGRIYMHRFRPGLPMHARPLDHYPAVCKQAAAIMLMIQNNLDPAVAQHPHELITYGGNGAVFQNWAQYLLTMKYLSRDDRRADPGDVFRPPAGPVPQPPETPRVCGDQRHDDPQLQRARRLGALQRPGRHAVRPDDRRQLHVHRSAGHRARHHHHHAERRPAIKQLRRFAVAGRQDLRHQRPGRHERRAAQGGGHRRAW